MALIWDDAVRITYNVNPLTAAILICSFAQYKLRKCLQTDSLMWHFAIRELEKLCQEKNIDWQIVKKVEMSLGFMREEIEKDPEDQHGIDYEVFFDSASRVLPSDCSPMDKALMMYILIDAFVPAPLGCQSTALSNM